MAAVEFAIGAIDGEVETCDAADAEVQLLLAGGVYGAVADEPYVGFEEIFVRCDDLLQSGRTCFFLAFEEEFKLTSDGVPLRRSRAASIAIIGPLSSEAPRA